MGEFIPEFSADRMMNEYIKYVYNDETTANSLAA
jgi:hypothetical protein